MGSTMGSTPKAQGITAFEKRPPPHINLMPLFPRPVTAVVLSPSQPPPHIRTPNHFLNPPDPKPLREPGVGGAGGRRILHSIPPPAELSPTPPSFAAPHHNLPPPSYRPDPTRNPIFPSPRASLNHRPSPLHTHHHPPPYVFGGSESGPLHPVGLSFGLPTRCASHFITPTISLQFLSLLIITPSAPRPLFGPAGPGQLSFSALNAA